MEKISDDCKVCVRLLESIKGLGGTKKCLDSGEQQADSAGVYYQKSLPLSHWRHLCNDANSAYKLMEDGANLVKAASTKYTLISKINTEEGLKLVEELQKGCQFVCTGVVLIYSPSVGCGSSCRHHARKAAIGILSSVVNLIDSFSTGEALEKNVGAQKTGAVWACCDVILEKKLPKGNRTAMRRDLFQWMSDCNETINEFQEIIDLGASSKASTIKSSDQQNGSKSLGDDSWFDFLGGENEQQYLASELRIAIVSVSLIKCTRGTIKCVLMACDCVGNKVHDDNMEGEEEKKLLAWISFVHDLARVIGEGMTDMGSLLYPPLGLECTGEENELYKNIKNQADCLIEIHDSINNDDLEGKSIVALLSEEVVSLSRKIRSAVLERQKEADDFFAGLK